MFIRCINNENAPELKLGELYYIEDRNIAGNCKVSHIEDQICSDRFYALGRFVEGPIEMKCREDSTEYHNPKLDITLRVSPVDGLAGLFWVLFYGDKYIAHNRFRHILATKYDLILD